MRAQKQSCSVISVLWPDSNSIPALIVAYVRAALLGLYSSLGAACVLHPPVEFTATDRFLAGQKLLWPFLDWYNDVRTYRGLINS